MTHYDMLYSKALQNYGVATSAVADSLGLQTNEVTRFCQDGRLKRVGQGVYILADYTPTKLTRFAEAIALVGKESYIYGESTLALCDLVPFDPGCVYVASPRRIRMTLPSWIKVVRVTSKQTRTTFGCIPSQTIVDALTTYVPRATVEYQSEIMDACRRNTLLPDIQRQAALEYLGVAIHNKTRNA